VLGGPSSSAFLQLARNAPSGFLQRVDDPRHIDFIRLRKRPAGAERGGNISQSVEDGRAQASRAQTIFFVIHGVAGTLHLLQVGEKFGNGSDGFRRPFFQALLFHDCFDFIFWQPGQQAFSDAGGMQKHSPSHPRVHLEESGRFHFFDIDGFALIENREMHGHSNLLAEYAQERKCEISDVEIGLGIAAEAQDFQAQAVPSRFQFTPQVTAFLERSEDVARGTLGDSELAADFRVGKSFAALGGGFGLVCVSDIALAGESAAFALPEVRLGIVPAVISPYVVARVGLTCTRQLMLTGARIGAAEARELGIVHEACLDDELDDFVDAAVRDILRCAPQALRACKRLLFTLAGPPDDTLASRVDLLNRLRAGEEAQQGMRAFLAKQPAPWAPQP